MVNIASIFWVTLCEHLAMFTKSLAPEAFDYVTSVTNRLKAASLQILEGGELMPQSWCMPYTTAQRGVICYGENEGVLKVEETNQTIACRQLGTQGTTPVWTK